MNDLIQIVSQLHPIAQVALIVCSSLVLCALIVGVFGIDINFRK